MLALHQMAQVICERCGHTGKPKKVTQGSFAMELVLWLVLCVPGLIYTVWRMTSRRPACASCGGEVIALLSPRGRQLHAYYYPGQQLPP